MKTDNSKGDNQTEDDEEGIELPFINSSSDLGPSIDWSKVDIDSIGSNFEVLDAPKKPPKAAQEMSPRLAKFVIGASPHLFFVMQPKISRYVVRKTQPINANNKITDSDKNQWASALSRNMKSMSSFFERDLLPLTAALVSSTLNSQERFLQLADDPDSKLPLGFILKKANLAAQLKIIDKICDFMGLSAENRKLMKAEFRHHPSKPEDAQ